MAEQLKTNALHSILIVKKANDFRVMGEFAWFTAVLHAIIDKDPNFDSSKMIMALTFSDCAEPTTADIEAFWTKLWKTSGLAKSKHKQPSAARLIRHSKQSTTSALHAQLAPLLESLPAIKKIETSLRTIASETKEIIQHGSEGVQEVHQEVASCFSHG